MRFTFIPWVALAVLAVASGEVALPRDSMTPAQRSEPVETITRDISLASSERAESVESFSGSITLRRDSHVAGDVETETGDLILEPGAEVAGDLSSESGTIRIDGARVAGRATPPRVVIGARATVPGVLRFKRKVELLVSDSATIGPVVGATPVMFATESPPQSSRE